MVLKIYFISIFNSACHKSNSQEKNYRDTITICISVVKGLSASSLNTSVFMTFKMCWGKKHLVINCHIYGKRCILLSIIIERTFNIHYTF